MFPKMFQFFLTFQPSPCNYYCPFFQQCFSKLSYEADVTCRLLIFSIGKNLRFKSNIFQDSFNEILSQQLTHDMILYVHVCLDQGY